GKRSPASPEEDVDACADRSRNYQVCNRQKNKARAKDSKKPCINILRQGTVKKLYVAVEDCTFRQLPCRVELFTKIEEGVRPFSPRGCHKKSREAQQGQDSQTFERCPADIRPHNCRS